MHSALISIKYDIINYNYTYNYLCLCLYYGIGFRKYEYHNQQTGEIIRHIFYLNIFICIIGFCVVRSLMWRKEKEMY